ncbi:MAG: hypothetical protein J6O88_05235 [Chryseobacterium sp.]|uniref:hypothetical protein n=1 Tax=Chryseobacterium sp. TaxID=1871047 RepID=UPI001B2D08ED|nr:hypothetical protein [Chryseobacterium sp.]MBO6184085.1 hypothetical protein [Chryseobacterium sp.]
MFSILDLESQFSKQKINKSKKMTVREFEEESKNHFVSFVDDEIESFDVQIVLNPKSEIIKSSCDCNSNDFCLHQLALSIFISENNSGKTTSKKTTKRKISEAEMVMEDLNSEEMKSWLLEFFKKNKDAEMQFLLEFAETKKEFSDDEIKQIIIKTTQSVVGKKKNIAAQDVKKIVDLMTKSLEPVEQFLSQNINKESSFEKFLLINTIIVDFQMSVYTSSTRIDKFLENFKIRFASYFNSIKDIEIWEKSAEKYWNVFFNENIPLTIYFYQFILEMYHSGTKEQKIFIAERVKNQIIIWIKNKVDLRSSIKEDLLPIIAENGFFPSLQKYFPIALYENSYNIKVINEVIKIDESKAEEFCKKIINRNTNEKYNLPYYEILEGLYEKSNNVPGLAYVKRGKFNSNYNLEDYIFIEKNEEDREIFKKFRTRVLSNLKGSFRSDEKYSEMYFAILEHEKNYKKMLEVINDGVSSEVINKYAKNLYDFDRKKFLSASMKRSVWNSEEGDENLVDFLVEKYDVDELRKQCSNQFFGFGTAQFTNLLLAKITELEKK